MLITNFEKFRKSQKEQEEPSVREFRKIQTVFNTMRQKDEKEDSRINDDTKILEDNVKETQHIDEYRRFNKEVFEETEFETRQRKVILKSLNRPHSEDRIREYRKEKTYGNKILRNQGFSSKKLTPLKHNASTSAVRE
mmetsp:Transcript_30252/g.26817  ORF Transcript_30252/g.26817 Transcript_30252/m.26817 type:complete len:138 (+) Transcript_30252:195-608(+)